MLSIVLFHIGTAIAFVIATDIAVATLALGMSNGIARVIGMGKSVAIVIFMRPRNMFFQQILPDKSQMTELAFYNFLFMLF